MNPDNTNIRIALPSKGRLSSEALDLFSNAGMPIFKPNPRQYQATIPNLPEVNVIFQRAGDIVTSVRDGSVEFGITGWDIYSEKMTKNGDLLVLLRDLRFGSCTLNVIVPEKWQNIQTVDDLANWQKSIGRPIRVATKFPVLTEKFFKKNNITNLIMIASEGTLEIAPTIGYADVIVDLISSGTTLRDNRLKALQDGLILHSQACLLGNRQTLKNDPNVLGTARRLIEFIVAHLRAVDNVSIFANIRGDSPERIADRMLAKSVIGGLQGPTISPILNQDSSNWYAVHLIVRKDQLSNAIREIREVGGSGVVVSPVMYIFEEEPAAFQELLSFLEV